jgi:transposase
MGGWDVRSEVLFSYVNCEQRVRKDHPLRAIVDEALAVLSPEFEGLYAKFGRRRSRLSACAPPLQAFYSVRSERQLMERLEYDLLFRLVGLLLDDEIWDKRVFTKPRAPDRRGHRREAYARGALHSADDGGLNGRVNIRSAS